MYKKGQYMAVVGSGHTGIPSVWNNGVELAFETEWYSDDVVVLAVSEEPLVAMLSRQDTIAPGFQVGASRPIEGRVLVHQVDPPPSGHDDHTGKKTRQGPATRQTAGHLGGGQPSPQRGGRDAAATQGPDGTGILGNGDHR